MNRRYGKIKQRDLNLAMSVAKGRRGSTPALVMSVIRLGWVGVIGALAGMVLFFVLLCFALLHEINTPYVPAHIKKAQAKAQVVQVIKAQQLKVKR